MNGNRKAANIITMLNATTFYSMCYVLHSNAWHVYGFKKKKKSSQHKSNSQYSSFSYTFLNVCVHLCLLFLNFFNQNFHQKLLFKYLN